MRVLSPIFDRKTIFGSEKYGAAERPEAFLTPREVFGVCACGVELVGTGAVLRGEVRGSDSAISLLVIGCFSPDSGQSLQESLRIVSPTACPIKFKECAGKDMATRGD